MRGGLAQEVVRKRLLKEPPRVERKGRVRGNQKWLASCQGKDTTEISRGMRGGANRNLHPSELKKAKGTGFRESTTTSQKGGLNVHAADKLSKKGGEKERGKRKGEIVSSCSVFQSRSKYKELRSPLIIHSGWESMWSGKENL